MSNNKSKNVKLPEDLIDAVKKRAPDAAPGETLLAIYKEYEKLETLAKCVSEVYASDSSKGPVYDMLKPFIDTQGQKFDVYQRSIDELKTMLQGLQLFFTKINART